MIQDDVKLICSIEFDDNDDDEENIFIYINLINQSGFKMTLEFADITEKFNDFLAANDRFGIYDDIDELISDLELGYFRRFMGILEINKKIDLLINLRMKLLHKKGMCDEECVMCNSDYGTDPFPDFTFDVKAARIEDDEPN